MEHDYTFKAPGLDRLIQKLDRRESFIKSQDKRIVDLKKDTTFVSGPFLHQDNEEISEHESAQFELENKELFRWLRSLANQIENA